MLATTPWPRTSKRGATKSETADGLEQIHGKNVVAVIDFHETIIYILMLHFANGPSASMQRIHMGTFTLERFAISAVQPEVVARPFLGSPPGWGTSFRDHGVKRQQHRSQAPDPGSQFHEHPCTPGVDADALFIRPHRQGRISPNATRAAASRRPISSLAVGQARLLGPAASYKGVDD